MAIRLFIVLVILTTLAVSGCGRSNKPRINTDTGPVIVTLVSPVTTTIQEAENPNVQVTISIDSTASFDVTVPLTFSGSATRDHDYSASDDIIVVPQNATSASVNLDVYRDFDLEGDETITVGLGEIVGYVEAGPMSSFELTILDGESVTVDKTPEDGGADLVLFPTHYIVNDASIDFGILVLNFSNESVAPTQLFVDWSSDLDFETDVNPLGIIEIPAFEPDVFVFPEIHEFTLPLNLLAPDQSYYIKAYLSDVPEETGDGRDSNNEYHFGFSTTSEGKVRTRCEAPMRDAGPTGSDPLFPEQWNLQNTGQSGFAMNPGVAGADLQMTGAIDNGQNGDGVKLAVVDTGLEICHPDLADNIEEGQSYNFAFENTAGSTVSDPFNHDILGDHGTSVAGVAAAVANNGLGGRGVAPDIELRGFNLGSYPGADYEVGLLKTLGGSSSHPDSASAHIFNMSFGIFVPSQNSEKDFVNLVKMGTSDLREGLGVLYVRAGGNAFSFCGGAHPLNREVGCISSNSDPDQNLPYLITVGAFNAKDVKSSYSSAGANLWVVAPGGEDGEEYPAIITTDQIGVHAGYSSIIDSPLTADHPLNPDGDYISAFGGTSSAAPATAGVIAILLGVNPDLTWRDIKHILAASARKIDPDIAAVRVAFNGQPYIAQHAWQTNAAGYAYHNWYGFGAVAVDEAVVMANGYTSNGLGEFVQSPWFEATSDMEAVDIPDRDGAGVTDMLEVTELPNTANMEAVILDITVNHSYGSDLGVTLTSPGGTESIVNAPFNPILDGFPGMLGWQLMSNAFYGEDPNGTWTLQVVDLVTGDTGRLGSWRLRFYYGDHPD